MKTNFTRILCLLLVLLMSITAFAACKKDDDVTKTDVSTDVTSQDIQEEIIVEVTEDDPYTVSKDKDGKDVVILTPNADGSVTMTVAEKTTLEAFLAVVAAKEGHAIKVLDAEGKEVTDVKTVIAKGMKFQVFADGDDAAKVEMIIDVVTEKQIEATVQKNEEIKKENSEALVNKPVQDPDKDPGDSKVEPSDPKNPTTSPVAPPSKPDYKEENITLGSVWSSKYNKNDAISKIWLTTFDTIKNQYNINTSVIGLDGNTATDLIIKEAMAGNSSADVYEVSAYMCRSIARKGVSLDLFQSKTLKKENFDNAGTVSSTFSGKAYGISIDYDATRPMGVIYNKDLIRKYAPDYDIEKLFNEKKWTFDTFRAVAQACTKDTNGDGRSDIYGFTSNTNVIGMALTSNAGGTACMENGKVVATMCSDAGVAALEWMKTLYGTDKSWKYFASINDSVSYFAAGNAAMFASWMSYYTTIVSKADFSIGFVLMPIGPDQKDYITGQYDARYFVVPVTKEARLETIATWLNGISAASTKLINNELAAMARNGLDETARDIYKWSVYNASPEFSSGVFTQNVSSKVDSSVTNRSTSPSKVMSAIKSQAQKELDDFFNPLY